MARRHEFRPRFDGELESRVVLSRMSIRQAHIAALTRRAVPPVVGQINRAFDTFIQDYSQARAAYLATLPAPTATSPSRDAFLNYSQFRVNALGQQLNRIFLSATQFAKKGKSIEQQAIRFNSIVQRNVSGLTPPTTDPPPDVNPTFRIGTLGRALVDTTPPANSEPSAVGLNILAQDQAIEASRAAVINGFTLVKKSGVGRRS
jgi:hypothetical protein